ncbi:hypothetical protein ABTE00_22245, partial [Acinetobacter baumannii]
QLFASKHKCTDIFKSKSFTMPFKKAYSSWVKETSPSDELVLVWLAERLDILLNIDRSAQNGAEMVSQAALASHRFQLF